MSNLDDDMIERAHRLRERIGAMEREAREASWALDAALSALRKDGVGYRTRNAANPDGGANYQHGQLQAAMRRAAETLARFGPPIPYGWDNPSL